MEVMKTISCIPLRCSTLTELNMKISTIEKKKYRHQYAYEIWLDDIKEWKSAKGDIKKSKQVIEQMMKMTKCKLLLKFWKICTPELIKMTQALNIFAIDIDLATAKKIIKSVKKIPKSKTSKTKIIISNHIEKTASTEEDLLEHLLELRSLGADIPKLVIPHNQRKVADLVETLLMVMSRLSYPAILHSNGPGSKLTRSIMATAGSQITYIAAKPSERTGKGQWTIQEWERIVPAL